MNEVISVNDNPYRLYGIVLGGKEKERGDKILIISQLFNYPVWQKNL